MSPAKKKSTSKKLVDIPQHYLVLMMEAGYAYLAMRRFEEALELFDGMTAIAPQSEIPHLALGNVHAAKQDLDLAKKEFNKALKLNDACALAWAHLGEMALLEGDKQKAKVNLTKAIELDGDGKAGSFAKALQEASDQGVFPLSELMAKHSPKVTTP